VRSAGRIAEPGNTPWAPGCTTAWATLKRSLVSSATSGGSVPLPHPQRLVSTGPAPPMVCARLLCDSPFRWPPAAAPNRAGSRSSGCWFYRPALSALASFSFGNVGSRVMIHRVPPHVSSLSEDGAGLGPWLLVSPGGATTVRALLPARRPATRGIIQADAHGRHGSEEKDQNQWMLRHIRFTSCLRACLARSACPPRGG